MAGRKRNSAEHIVHKLRRADELTAEGRTGEEIAAELEVSPATVYNWRRSDGEMDTDAAKELKELREQNDRLKRLLAEAELDYDERREVNKKKIHRLWREEGLQVKIRSPRERAGVSSLPPIAANAPNVVWAGERFPVRLLHRR